MQNALGWIIVYKYK